VDGHRRGDTSCGRAGDAGAWGATKRILIVGVQREGSQGGQLGEYPLVPPPRLDLQRVAVTLNHHAMHMRAVEHTIR